MAALLLVGCRADADPWAELPTPDHVGERVVVASDAVDRVCAGTLAMLDAEVNRIESELAFASTVDPYRVWILESERASSICGGSSSCADVEHGAVVSAKNFEVERRSAHELAPLLLSRAGVVAHNFFVEGIARAVSWPTCPSPWPPDNHGVWIDRVHEFEDHEQLAGELVRWLLGEYGPQLFFDYLRMLPPDSKSSYIRMLYSAYFGSKMEHDAIDHSGLSWSWDMPCSAPEPEPAGSRRVALRAGLDCDSPRVQTDFDTPGFGFVEWTLPASDGLYRVHGELPEGSRLEITRCMCDRFWKRFMPFDPAGTRLSYETYQLRWHGPLDAGLELDVELETPCDVYSQDCPTGSKCLHGELPCQPLVDEPLAIGEPCTRGADELDPCVAGARCFGEPDGDGKIEGRCMAQCGQDHQCGAGDLCGHGVCAASCDDPIGDDCVEDDLVCTTTIIVDRLLCLPIGAGTSGEPCKSVCAPGLICTPLHMDSCDSSRCCLPICDATLGGADCPADLPFCIIFWPDQLFGHCISH